MEWIQRVFSKVSIPMEAQQFNAVSTLFAIVIMVSTLAVYMVGNQVRHLVAAVQTASAERANHKVAQAKVEKKPLPAAEMTRYLEVLRRLHPAVTIDLTPDQKMLAITVPEVALYNEWMFALYSLQSYGKNVLWDVNRICLRNCGGGAAVAVVQGYTQSVSFK